MDYLDRLSPTFNAMKTKEELYAIKQANEILLLQERHPSAVWLKEILDDIEELLSDNERNNHD